MPRGGDRFEGLSLGYARAHYGRVCHIVEVERYVSRTETGPEGETIQYHKDRVARALCGTAPVAWEAPSSVGGHVHVGCLHRACRLVLQEKEQLEAQRVDHVIGAPG
jgi:hypothetical protein